MRTRGPGSKIGPGLEVVAHLRRGRDLDVYDCWDSTRLCRVVVKAPRPGVAEAPGMIRREARLLRRLSHPNLVRVIAVHDDAKRPLLVLETLTGATVGSLLDEKVLSAHEASILGQQLCGVLVHMHAEGLLHLDLKPSNVIAQGGQAKLIDLSLARPPGRGKAGLGTWCYAAPEQAAGQPLNAACDVWGLGLLLHEGVTGEPAFDVEGETDDHPQCHRRAPRARSLRRSVPKPLDDLLHACLDPAPTARPKLLDVHERLRAI